MLTRGASGAPRQGVGITDGLDVGASGCCETFAGVLCLCGRTIIVERIEMRKSRVWYGFLYGSMQRLLEGDSLLGVKLQMIF